jgi:hypothetical protein
MTCKGICIRHKAQKPLAFLSRYASGQKRCRICELFIKWEELWCPCCGHLLRTTPRDIKYKTKMRAERKEIEKTM